MRSIWTIGVLLLIMINAALVIVQSSQPWKGTANQMHSLQDKSVAPPQCARRIIITPNKWAEHWRPSQKR